MKNALRDLFSSKKFQTAIIGLIVAGGARYGLDLDDEAAGGILAVFLVLLHAQGAQDFGKEAAKVAATTPAVPQTVQINEATIEAPGVVAMPGLSPR